ncbi:MAG: DUF6151 family protein [Pseudomonadales bacterium]|nr:DUF6151 family protein [Pseudomonadales bacterium]MDP6471135.1 DUF6151 family protein [Pseudomonadales bacterium]MDP6825679.1 DUF6151 family protein [Pseudomonadales bacterium]MDP6971647.1 DUF6151 family protein [Pseudomonadales bacterium]
MDFALRCDCGTVRGSAQDVSPGLTNRVICYCSTCQAFAHYLGRGADILDANGGSGIVQFSQGRLRLDQGAQRLACVRLTENGPLRWYADCCKSPIGNTPSNRKLPSIGLSTNWIDVEVSGCTLDALLGPVRHVGYPDHAVGDTSDLPVGTHSLRATIRRFYKIVLSARLHGDRKRSPFFDAATGKPMADPREDERADD